MGYNSVYAVYHGKKYLGLVTGWTQDEATKRAKEKWPSIDNLIVRWRGENK